MCVCVFVCTRASERACVFLYIFVSLKVIGPLIDKEIKKNYIQKNSIGPNVFTISVCLSVCLSVYSVQVTVFVVGF